MRVIGAAAVASLVAGSTSSAGSGQAGAPTGPKRTEAVAVSRTPLVGITWGANITAAMQGGELVRVDPRSFRPLPGPRIELGFHGYSWSYSPDRSQLAIGGFASGIRFVDLERFEAVGDLRENRRGGLVVGIAWPKPHRVLAVVQEPWGAGELTLAVVDPVERRVLEWRPLSLSAGAVQSIAGKSGLVLLLAPLGKPRRETVGPARLLFIDVRGRARSLVLKRVLMGQEAVARGPSGIVLRWWQPGLALDSAGRRVFVVAGGAPVAEVDLRSMRVTYHELREPITLLGRLHNWLEPKAQAKGEFEGPARTARWLGDSGRLAVSGFDGRGESPTDASGLKVIDTRTWAVRTIESEAADFVSMRGLLLASCCNFPTGGDALGLAAYDPNGRRLWHLFQGRPIPGVEAAGGRAYALIPTRVAGARPPWVAVVDVRRGKVLRKVQTPWMHLLLP